ncbi:MAG: hypothetical protein Q7J69_06085, partial [Candidatus Omnitrophota bacterium]|nr:hypothetical protein [Candidatus Omnitrophota bacterium]
MLTIILSVLLSLLASMAFSGSVLSREFTRGYNQLWERDRKLDSSLGEFAAQRQRTDNLDTSAHGLAINLDETTKDLR